jgi:serralysin
MTINNSGQPDYVRLLTSGQVSWTGSSGGAVSQPIKYSFDKTKLTAGGTGTDTMDSTQKAAVVAALQAWVDVAGVQFAEDDSSPDIVLVIKSLPSERGETMFYSSGSQLTHADIFIDEADFTQGYNAGQDGFHTILHEIGHALGGSHPGGYTAAAGSNPLYNHDGTSMSYNFGPIVQGTPYASTPMAYDIAFMQFLYGVNATGNSTTPHYINGAYSTIATLWDNDGGDSIEVSGSGYNATIDLREGPGYHSQVNTNVFFIAYGANIDKAVGGGSADTIIGNGHGNSLSGGAGNDTITPGAGNDTVTTGSNNDTVVFEFNPTDTDTVTDFSLGSDKLDLTALGVFASTLQADATESGGTTTLHINGMDIVVTGVTKTNLFNPSNDAFTGLIGGTAGNNLVGSASGEYLSSSNADIYSHYATANNDTITGNAGNDYLYGVAGNDTYIWTWGDGNDGIADNESETNVLRLSGVDASEVYLTAINPYPWYFIARMSSNGGTTVNGQVTVYNQNTGTAATEIRYIQMDDATWDTHTGMHWRAIDTASGEQIEASPWYDANDTMDASASDHDTLKGYGGDDLFNGGGGNNRFYGGNGNDTLYGGTGYDALDGENGNDSLNGGADVDSIYGSDGNDTLDGGAGFDGLVGGNGNDTFIVVAGEGNTNIQDYSGNNVLEIGGAAYTYANNGNDRTLTITSTGEIIWLDDYNLHSSSWTII